MSAIQVLSVVPSRLPYFYPPANNPNATFPVYLVTMLNNNVTLQVAVEYKKEVKELLKINADTFACYVRRAQANMRCYKIL